MRYVRLAGAAVLVGVLAIGVTSSNAQSGKVRCTIKLQTLAAPTDLKGEDFGTVRCNRVFGRGVQHNDFSVTPASPTTGKVTGSFKEYFDKGSIRGRFALDFSATPAGEVSYTGTSTITGGTGAYRRARGSAKLSCASAGPGRTNCISEITLRRR